MNQYIEGAILDLEHAKTNLSFPSTSIPAEVTKLQQVRTILTTLIRELESLPENLV